MDPTERFIASIAPGVFDVRLDVAALSIAAHAHTGLDIDAWCGRIDELAASCVGSDFEAVRVRLFEQLGFRGNTARYRDPENSFLDSVIERRAGLPITLSVLCIEVGRRLGIAVHGIGMPGHFLVQAAGASVWCDPFNGGARLDLAGCERAFDAVHGGARAFDVADLAPTPPRAIVSRMLTNLEHGPLGTNPGALVWMCGLHLAIPDVPVGERVRLVRRLVAIADPATVQAAYEVVAAAAPEEVAGPLRDEARRLAARRN
ncbi:MAG: transglutaminase family protein [Actinomycetota bacterium]